MGFGYRQWELGLWISSVGTWAFDIANEDWVFDITNGNWAFDIVNENWVLMLPMKIGF